MFEVEIFIEARRWGRLTRELGADVYGGEFVVVMAVRRMRRGSWWFWETTQGLCLGHDLFLYHVLRATRQAIDSKGKLLCASSASFESLLVLSEPGYM